MEERLLHIEKAGEIVTSKMVLIVILAMIAFYVVSNLKQHLKLGTSEQRVPNEATEAPISNNSLGRLTKLLRPSQELALKTGLYTQNQVPESVMWRTFYAEAAGISLGDVSLLPVFMVVDPECPVCKQAVRHLLPYLQAGKLHLRIILMRRDQTDIVPSLLATEARVTHLMDIMLGEITASSLVKKPNEASLQATAINDAMMKRFNVTQFPTFVFYDRGGKPQRLNGYSPLLASVLSVN